MLRSSRTLFALACLALLHYSAAAADFHCDLAQHEPFLDQANRFILAGLQFQPVEATQAGYHGDANVLDNELDDSSPETIAAQRKLMLAGKICFAAVKVTPLRMSQIWRCSATTSIPPFLALMCSNRTAIVRRTT